MSKLRFSKVNAFIGHQQSVYCLSADGLGGFFSAGSEGKIVHWPSIDSTDGLLFAQIPEAIFSLIALNKDVVFAGSQFGNLYRLERGQEAQRLTLNQKGLFDIQFDENQVLWVAGGEGVIFSISSELRLLSQLRLSNKSLRTVLFDDQNNWMVGSSDGNIYNQKGVSIRVSDMSVFQLKSDLNGNWYVAGRDAKIRKYNAGFQLLQHVNAHWFTIHTLALSPSGAFLASGSMDKSIRIWKSENLELVLSIGDRSGTIHKSSVNSLIWLDDETLISCSDDAQIYCWKIHNDGKN